MNKTDQLRDSWASLGVAFYASSDSFASPEEALIQLVQSGEFPEDKKILTLALTWLKEHSKLVHIERLQNHFNHLANQEKVLLGAIAQKCVQAGDHRWKKIAKDGLKVSKKKDFSFPSDSSLLLKMRGHDKDFEKFKIYVTALEDDSYKKLLDWKQTVSTNPWIKFRLLFGSNLRADVAAVIHLRLASTAYGAAKYLNCSTSAVYRNWNDLIDIGWDKHSKVFAK